MRFRELIYEGSKIRDNNKITNIIEKNDMHWLIDSEIENAVIEIKNKTLIWHDGDYYSGNWHYGIFKGGNFHGVFENGIFENGNFNGEFISGVNLTEKE